MCLCHIFFKPYSCLAGNPETIFSRHTKTLEMTVVSGDGLASPTIMKTFKVIKYLNIYSTNK